MERWGPHRVDDLVRLTDVALAGENLTADELAACLWDDPDPSIVLGLADGDAAIAGVVRSVGGRPRAFLQLIAVAPPVRRRGHGLALVEALRQWAGDEHGATTVSVGGGAPFYLWPGVDVHATPAVCLFEAAGFLPRGAELNMGFPSRHRAPCPDGFEVERVLEEAASAAALEFVDRHWPNWVAETGRGIEHGTCHVVRSTADGAVVGFGCHSVNRLGWLGPMGTDPTRRAAGLGNALLSAIATDLMAAGVESVEVAWIGPARFYAKAAGATISRAFRTLDLRPGRAAGSA